MKSRDQSDQLLAIIEAEVGALLELLPVPLLVTSATGQILRANAAATLFVDSIGSLTGKNIDTVLGRQSLSVTTIALSHADYVLQIMVLQQRHSERAVVSEP
jgi:nitrogen-specific signal transduction histidine kinase